MCFPVISPKFWERLVLSIVFQRFRGTFNEHCCWYTWQYILKTFPSNFDPHFLKIHLYSFVFSSGIGAIPVIRKPLGNITISYCTILKKVIPKDAYYESTPGQTFTLKLLGGGNILARDNWPLINFDSTTWTLYVVPTSRSISQTAHIPGEYFYTIRAENPETTGIADDTFWLKLVDEQDVNQRNFGYELENKLLTNETKNVINLYNYVEKIFNFFKTPTTDKVIQVKVYLYSVCIKNLWTTITCLQSMHF